MPVTYFVARSRVDPQGTIFYSAFDDMEEALNQVGLTLDNPISEETDVQVVQTWPLRDNDAKVSIYDNHFTGVRHIELSAEDENVFDMLKTAARDTLPLEDHETLLKSWTEGKAKRTPELLTKLALSAPDPIDATSAKVIVEAMDDPDAQIRARAAYCCAVLADPEFEDPLLARAAIESDAEVLAYIDRALSVFGVA